jgi:hypothetical protein
MWACSSRRCLKAFLGVRPGAALRQSLRGICSSSPRGQKAASGLAAFGFNPSKTGKRTVTGKARTRRRPHGHAPHRHPTGATSSTDGHERERPVPGSQAVARRADVWRGAAGMGRGPEAALRTLGTNLFPSTPGPKHPHYCGEGRSPSRTRKRWPDERQVTHAAAGVRSRARWPNCATSRMDPDTRVAIRPQSPALLVPWRARHQLC